MWISEKMAAPRISERTMVSGEVTGGQDVRIAAQGETEYRRLALAAPWGIAYLSPTGARVVILGGTENPACTGTVVETGGLEPGELLLFSAGGARVCLKNSGKVVIDGQTFSAAGGSQWTSGWIRAILRLG